MISLPMWAIPVVGIGFLLLIIYQMIQDVRKAKEKDKRRLAKVYLIVGMIGVLLFIGIRLSPLPKMLYPEYYPVEQIDRNNQE